MKKFITAFKKLFILPAWCNIILVIASSVGLAFVFSKNFSHHVFGYFVYAFSFYSLVVLSLLCVHTLPFKIKEIKNKFDKTKFGNSFLHDPVYRTHISLYLTLFINIFFVAINIFHSVINSTWWYAIFALYYAILVVLRFVLVRYINRKPIGSDILSEWKTARICSVVLTLINLVLSGAVLMVISQGRSFIYNGILIYVMALYAFYTTTLSIINIFKYHKYKSPILSMTKVVALAAALISMLQLETAMLSAFGADTPQKTKNLLIAITGAIICITLLFLSFYIIIRSIKETKRRDQNEQ